MLRSVLVGLKTLNFIASGVTTLCLYMQQLTKSIQIKQGKEKVLTCNL